MFVLVTCKYGKDWIQNSRENLLTLTIMSLWGSFGSGELRRGQISIKHSLYVNINHNLYAYQYSVSKEMMLIESNPII